MKEKAARQTDQKGKARKNKVAEHKRLSKLAKIHTKNPWCKCKRLFESVLPTWFNGTITYSTIAEKEINFILLSKI